MGGNPSKQTDSIVLKEYIFNKTDPFLDESTGTSGYSIASDPGYQAAIQSFKNILQKYQDLYNSHEYDDCGGDFNGACSGNHNFYNKPKIVDEWGLHKYDHTFIKTHRLNPSHPKNLSKCNKLDTRCRLNPGQVAVFNKKGLSVTPYPEIDQSMVDSIVSQYNNWNAFLDRVLRTYLPDDVTDDQSIKLCIGAIRNTQLPDSYPNIKKFAIHYMTYLIIYFIDKYERFKRYDEYMWDDKDVYIIDLLNLTDNISYNVRHLLQFAPDKHFAFIGQYKDDVPMKPVIEYFNSYDKYRITSQTIGYFITNPTSGGDGTKGDDAETEPIGLTHAYTHTNITIGLIIACVVMLLATIVMSIPYKSYMPLIGFTGVIYGTYIFMTADIKK